MSDQEELSGIQLAILEKLVVTPEPAFIAKEFIEDLDHQDYTEEGIRYNLEKLVKRGLLERKKPGERTVMYWITPDGEKAYFREAG